jgi:thiol-disulfide isomerase/thioredoxin
MKDFRSPSRQPRFTILAVVALAVTTSFIFAETTESKSAIPLGQKGPPLGFRLLSGKEPPTWQNLEGKVVVLDFWATWCSPCVGAFPKMNQLHQEFADKSVSFFSVTYEPDAYVREFLQKHPLESEIGIDDSFSAFKSFAAWGIPVVFVFDRDGRLAAAVHPDHLSSAVLSKVLAGEVPEVPQSKPWDDPAGAETYFKKLQQDLLKKYPSVR